MSFSANVAWEVRTTGSDGNGGGFVAGSSGTDYSQQDVAQATGTVTSAGTTVTATTGIFTAAMVGNFITDGTTWKQITAFTSTTIITVDSAPSWTAATIKVGGALLTIGKAVAVAVASNKIFVKAGSGYTITANINVTQSITLAYNALPTRLIGYTTTRGDAGKATITLSTNANLTGLNVNTTGVWVENFIVNCSSLSGSVGIYLATQCVAVNCTVQNFVNYGIQVVGPNCVVMDCLVNTGTFYGIYLTAAATGAYVYRNTITGCGSYGCYCNGANGVFSFNLVYANTTAGFLATFPGMAVLNNTFYANTGDGVRLNYLYGLHCRNNIMVSNIGYGLNNDAGQGNPAHPLYDGNAYYNNTSGTRHFFDDTTTNPINGVAPYTNVLDVILTADPFTNAAGADFTLNNTTGGGKACRGFGTPGPLPNVSQVGKIDLGALQHADPVSGGYPPITIG